MNDFKKIHDFLKYNYENGNFKEPDYHYEYYQQDNNYQNNSQKNNDFKLGYEHAQADYKCGKQFKFYPVKFLKIINKLVGNRLKEILDFMMGYNQAKNELK